jgi:hypothetical protein
MVMQVREFLSIVLVILLCVPLPAEARVIQTSRVAEKVLQIPEGAQIEVRLRNKDTLIGRLGRVSQESFHIQYARGEKVIDREVPFDQVKSVKKASGAAATETPQKRTVQQQVVEIPTGKLVEVRLTDKSRIRGRIGKISADGFLLTAARGNQVGEQKLAFSDVTSIKEIEKEGGGKNGTYIIVGAVAGAATLFVILLFLAAAGY